jgi:hypothetical protein
MSLQDGVADYACSDRIEKTPRHLNYLVVFLWPRIFIEPKNLLEKENPNIA